MIKEIRVKTLVSRVSGIDSIFGLDYSLNLYRGCQHRCIYCDSRSQCYGIEEFDRDVLIKVNAIELLKHELPRKRKKGIIGTGSMNDPYMPLEERVQLTRRTAGNNRRVRIWRSRDDQIRSCSARYRCATEDLEGVRGRIVDHHHGGR